MQLSIVIPCYNEAETIDRLVSVLDKSVADLATRGHPTEVIVVDDGSLDASFARLEQAARGSGCCSRFAICRKPREKP